MISLRAMISLGNFTFVHCSVVSTVASVQLSVWRWSTSSHSVSLSVFSGEGRQCEWRQGWARTDWLVEDRARDPLAPGPVPPPTPRVRTPASLLSCISNQATPALHPSHPAFTLQASLTNIKTHTFGLQKNCKKNYKNDNMNGFLNSEVFFQSI